MQLVNEYVILTNSSEIEVAATSIIIMITYLLHDTFPLIMDNKKDNIGAVLLCVQYSVSLTSRVTLQHFVQQRLNYQKNASSRLPDWSGIYASDNAILVHERLAIVDLNSGEQPLYNADKSHVLAVNGEIYNHKELRAEFAPDYPFQTESDCEIILALYKEKDFRATRLP